MNLTIFLHFLIMHLLRQNQSLNEVNFLKGALSRLRQFLATESPLQMIKNGSYFPLKLFSFSRHLNFCRDF